MPRSVIASEVESKKSVLWPAHVEGTVNCNIPVEFVCCKSLVQVDVH